MHKFVDKSDEIKYATYQNSKRKDLDIQSDEDYIKVEKSS